MKQLKLILAFIFISTCSYSQVNWGPTYTHKAQHFHRFFSNEDFFYATFWEGNTLNIEKYDKKDYKKIYLVKHKMPKNNTAVRLEKINGNFILIQRYYNKKTNEDIICADIFNAENGEKTTSQKTIISDKTDKKNETGDFWAHVSNDRKNILCIQRNWDWEKNNGHVVVYKLYDNEFNLITEQKIFEGKNEEVDKSLYGISIDNDGSTYEVKKNNKGELYIMCLDAKKDFEKWEEPLDFQKLGLPIKSVVKRINIIVDKKGDYNIVGYYSKNAETFDGIFIMKMDHISKNITVLKVNEFDNEFKKQFQSSANTQSDIKDRFNNIKLYSKDDGGIILAAEDYYAEHTDNGSKYSIHDMVVFNIAADGALLWAKKIEKHQKFHYNSLKFGKARYGHYLSFFGSIGNSEFSLIYNDNPKNYNENSKTSNLKTLRNPQKSVVVIKKINLTTGEISTKCLEKNKNLIVAPVYCYTSTDSKEITLCSRKKKKYRFGSISNL